MKLNTKQWEEIAIKYQNGEDIPKLADTYKVSRSGVHKRLIKMGIKIRKKLINHTGKRYGKLTVIGISENSRNCHSRWYVVCDCGVKKTVLGTHLVQGKINSCGCLRNQTPRNWSGCGKIPKTYYNSVLRGSLGDKGRKPVTFDIDIEYMNELYENQCGKCIYTGLPIDFKSKTASLDRIDSSLGYIRGNVQWVHKDINMMKRHYNHNYFIQLCKLVSQGN